MTKENKTQFTLNMYRNTTVIADIYSIVQSPGGGCLDPVLRDRADWDLLLVLARFGLDLERPGLPLLDGGPCMSRFPILLLDPLLLESDRSLLTLCGVFCLLLWLFCNCIERSVCDPFSKLDRERRRALADWRILSE